MTDFLSIVDLHKSFGQLQVLRGVTETINKGEIVSIIGPSGSGKSTFLRCLNQLERPDSGKVFFDGTEITDKKVDITLYRQKIGMVFQEFHAFPHLTVLDNITLAPMLEKKLSRKEAEDKAMSLLESVGLRDKAKEYPRKLSGGQKQRLAIVRAVAMDPEILLFDEPTSSLDPEMKKEVLEVIRKLVHEGMTTVIVSHEMTFVREISSRILFMDEGRFTEQGSPDSLFDSPQNIRTAEFLSKIL